MDKVIKVIEHTRSEESIEEHDYRQRILITQDDRDIFDVSDGEQEDGTIGRDFMDCHSVMGLIEEFYELGKSGVKVEFGYEEDL